MTTEIRALYTRLPAIDRLLRDPAFSSLLAQHGHSQVVTQLRQMLDEAREQIRQCQTLPDWSHDWLHACEQRLTAGQRSALRPVFNSPVRYCIPIWGAPSRRSRPWRRLPARCARR